VGDLNAGVRLTRTRPYRPQTNGKAERFIQTLLRHWAYAVPYPSSWRRSQALRPWRLVEQVIYAAA
jgi:transposase InsO family protein